MHFVVPNDMLKKRELEEFQDYWILSQLEDKVEYHDNLDFEHHLGQLIFIDEADFMLLVDPQGSYDKLAQSNVIAFSSSLD